MAAASLNNQRNDSQGHNGEVPIYFICYARHDREVVKKIHEEMQSRSKKYRLWRDERDLDAGCRIDSTIQEAIDRCSALLFVVTQHSVKSEYCLDELARGLEKKKTIVPLRLDPDAELPFRLHRVQYIDFSGNFEDGLEKLYVFLVRDRQASPPPPITTEPVVINDPPLIAPTCFQGRNEQHQLIEEFLTDDASALLWINGRAGSGKTALACRVLDQVLHGVWGNMELKVPIDAVAYLNCGPHSKPDWFTLLDELWRVSQSPSLPERERCFSSEVERLLHGLSERRVVLLIDHLDDLMNLESRTLIDSELHDVLRTVLSVTTHGLKLIVTSRVFPSDTPKVQEGRLLSLDLGEGLPQSEAMQLLRSLDRDGTRGLQKGEEKVLTELCWRTQGNPRAIERLYNILKKDRGISPEMILRDEKHFLPEEVMDALIGKTYTDLDKVLKIMMQVLSVVEEPVKVDGVECVFPHYLPDIDPRPALSRLVNLQLVERSDKGYRLLEADRQYAVSQLVDDTSVAEGDLTGVHLQRIALHKQWANYFKGIADFRAEFHSLYAAEDYAAAFHVLKELVGELSQQGRFEDAAQYCEQLAPKLEDVNQMLYCFSTLAQIYHRLGDLKGATECYQEWLRCARDKDDGKGQCVCLANLALCKQESGDLVETTLYCMAALELVGTPVGGAPEAHIWNVLGEVAASLGQISAAMQASKRALKLARDKLDRDIEVMALVNLGQHYEAQGNVDQACDECNRAHNFAENNQYQLGESAAMRNLGVFELNRGRYKSAIRNLIMAKELADKTQHVQLQQTTRIELAAAQLRDSKLGDAEATVNEAVAFDTLFFNPEALSLRGIILQHRGKTAEATESFHRALKQAEVVLKRTPRYYRGLEVMGLSYSGLMLSEETDEYLDRAIGAYEAAHYIANEPGIVRRRLLLFDALAQTDSEKNLTSVRDAITSPAS